MGAMKDRLIMMVEAGWIICQYCGDMEDGPWINLPNKTYCCERCEPIYLTMRQKTI